MTLQATIEVPSAAVTGTATHMLSDIDAKFMHLLEADRNSSEFADLWAEVDEYIAAAVAAGKTAAA